MDNPQNSISPDALYARLGSEAAPIIVDDNAVLHPARGKVFVA